MDRERLIELAKLLGWRVNSQDWDGRVWALEDHNGHKINTDTYSYSSRENAWEGVTYIHTGDGMVAVIERMRELKFWYGVTTSQTGLFVMFGDASDKPWDKDRCGSHCDTDIRTATAEAACAALKAGGGEHE